MSNLSFILSQLQPLIEGQGIEMNEENTEPSAPLEKMLGSLEEIDPLSPKSTINSDFAERNKNIVKKIQTASGVSNMASDALFKSGNPIAMGVGAALKIGSGISKSAKDEFGVVKDKGKAIVGGLLNPIEGLSTAFNQKGLKEAKTRFANTELASSRAKSQVAGNKITNAIPKYTPPGYGRSGGKLSKFTR